MFRRLPPVQQRIHQPPGAEGQGLRQGISELRIYIIETPFDDPGAFGVFRMACVRPRLFIVDSDGRPRAEKLPPSGLIQVDAQQFVDPAGFDPARDCVEPR